MRRLIGIVCVALALTCASRATVRTVRSVDTVADLLVLDPRSISRDGQATLHVSGFSRTNEWPFRAITYDAASTEPTNRLIFASTNWPGRWSFPDRFGPVQDVRLWGARGDGTNNDWAAIQAAIDWIRQTTNSSHQIYTRDTRGQTVLLPQGRYLVSQPIRLAPGIILRGVGRDASKIVNVGATNDVLVFQPTQPGALNPIRIEDLSITQDYGVAHTAGAAIKILLAGSGGGTTQLKLSQVGTARTWVGVDMDGAAVSSIESCEFSTHGSVGLRTGTLTTSTTISASWAKVCSGTGFEISGSYISIFGGAADGNGGYGYRVVGDAVTQAQGVMLINTGAEQNALGGILLQNPLVAELHMPFVVTRVADGPPITIDGGNVVTIRNPLLFCEDGTSTNYAVSMLTDTSGTYCADARIDGLAGAQIHQFGGLTAPSAEPFLSAVGNAKFQLGFSPTHLRIGPASRVSDPDQFSFGLLADVPTASGGDAYPLWIAPHVRTNNASVYPIHVTPIVDAPGSSIPLLIDAVLGNPTITAGAVERSGRLFLRDGTEGSALNFLLGSGTVAGVTGNWALYLNSEIPNYLAGSLDVGDAITGSHHLRIGPSTTIATNEAAIVVSAPIRGSAAGSSYSTLLRPKVDSTNSIAAALYTEPQVGAGSGRVTNLYDALFGGPVVASGTITRAVRAAYRETTAGSSMNAAIAIGGLAAGDGYNWSIFNNSTNKSLQVPPIQWYSSAGPIDTYGSGSPEFVISAVPGSVFRDFGGHVYVKTNGTSSVGWSRLWAGEIASEDVSDASAAGRALLTAANAAAQRAELELGALSVLNDAPMNGQPHGRKDGAWVEMSAGGGGVSAVAPTIASISRQSWSNSSSYVRVLSGTLNTTNLPYDGAMISGVIGGTWKQNSGTSSGFKPKVLINGTAVYESTSAAGTGDSSVTRAWRVDFNLFRVASNLISGGLQHVVSGASAISAGYGSLGTAATITTRPGTMADASCDLATNVVWELLLAVEVANNTNIVSVTYGGLK